MSTDRIRRLGEVLDQAGVDAFFAQTSISMGYLHGYFEGALERFLTLAISRKGDVRLICPALSANQARRVGINDIRSWADGEDPLIHLNELADEWDLRSGILAVDDEMPAQMLLKMQAVLPAALFKPGSSLISELMRRKEAYELDLMRQAAKVADDAYLDVLPHVKAGQTETEVADLLAEAMKARGGKPTFAIVATGANGAESHHINDDSKLKHGDVLIMDFGCEVGGYQSDITRTVAIGQASPEAQHAYHIVFAAHMAARAAIRPGIPAADVDAGAREVIAGAGMGELFVHRTGHGIGMRGHEEPFIIGDSDQPLVVGDCFSIEPGVYLPGQFGIRIENIVTVVVNGCESLNVDPEPVLRVV